MCSVKTIAIVPLLFPTLFGKRVFSLVPPHRGYSKPSHFIVIMFIYLIIECSPYVKQVFLLYHWANLVTLRSLLALYPWEDP